MPCYPQGTHGFPKNFNNFGQAIWPAIVNIYIYMSEELSYIDFTPNSIQKIQNNLHQTQYKKNRIFYTKLNTRNAEYFTPNPIQELQNILHQTQYKKYRIFYTKLNTRNTEYFTPNLTQEILNTLHQT